MTTTTAPTPAHFVILPALGKVGCYGRNHGAVCRRMPIGKCSGCGTQVAWHGDKAIMIETGHRDGHVTVACWGREHDCAAHAEAIRDTAAAIWHEVNTDLALRNSLRVQVITLEDIRPQVVEAGGNVEALDAQLATLRAAIAA